MVPLTFAEPCKINVVETIEKLTQSHTSKNLQSDTCPQSIYSQASPTKNKASNSPQNNATQPHDQSAVFVQQFSMIMQGLRNCMFQMSSDITKNKQAYTTPQ